MRKTRFLLTALLIAVLMPLVSIAHAQDNPKILRFADVGEPDVLIDYWDNGGSFAMMRTYMQPQWGKLPDGTVVPLLVDTLPSADNGGISLTPDGKSVIKFKIADWAVWSDGQPVIADDFKLVFDIATDNISNLRAFRFFNGAKVDSIKQGTTDKDVVITFSQAFPDWATAWIVPLPAHILRAPYEALLKDHKGMDTSPYLRAPTVGNGPYVFAEWKPGQYIRFTRNPKYWKTPYFDEVIYSIYQDPKVVQQLLVSGDTDINLFDIPYLQAVDLVNKNPDKVQLVTAFEGQRSELEMNMGPKGFPALKDVNVRKAIEMGIDRQGIIDNIYNGKSKVPHSYWDDTPWFNKNMPFVKFDADGAKALLKQEGWYDADGDGVVESHGVKDVPDNTPFVLKAATLAATDSSAYGDSMLAVQDNLSKIGIKISDINQFNRDAFYQPLSSNGPYSSGSADLYILHWATGVDSVNQFQLYACDQIPTEQNPGGLNGSQICNKDIDSLWKVLGTSMNNDERQKAADQIQQIMADQVLTIYLANDQAGFVLNKKIEGFKWGGFAGNPLFSLADMKRAQ